MDPALAQLTVSPPARQDPSSPPLLDGSPGPPFAAHRQAASPEVGSPSVAAGVSGLADPGAGLGAFGALPGGPPPGGTRKQQPTKPVPLRPPMGIPHPQPLPQTGLLQVKQNPDEDDDASSSDSDDEGAHMVPQMGGAGGGMLLPGGEGGAMQQYAAQPRKRGGDRSEEKERKRLKRLLRNRVSAQQARERKKAYLSDLETRSRELEQKNAELEERVSTLQRENFMLRQIVKNTTMKKNQANPS